MPDKHKKKKVLNKRFKEHYRELEADRMRKGPVLIEELRRRGCDLPFYESLEPYRDKLLSEIGFAMESISAIHKVELVDFKSYQVYQPKYHVPENWKLLEIVIEDDVGYNSKKHKGTYLGSCFFFLDESHSLKCLIVVSMPKMQKIGGDFRYGVMLATFFHELGHVVDALAKCHLDPETGRFDIIEGETFANCYALDKLADHCLPHMYCLLYEVIEDHRSFSDYRGKVAKSVMTTHMQRSVPRWSEWLDSNPI